MKSKKDLLLKIAKQLYAKLLRQNIKIPQKILQEALSFYEDYWKNNGQKGQDQIIYNFKSKKYILKDIDQKIKDWYLYKEIKRTFDNQIIFYFNDESIFDSNLSNDHKTIFINVKYTRSDFNDIIHQLTHYFQHMIVSKQQLDIFYGQLQIPYLKQFEKTSQYLTYINNAGFYLFELFKKTCNNLNFETFYDKIIETFIKESDTNHIDFKQLQTTRQQDASENVFGFLKLIELRDKQQYESLKQQIFKLVSQQSKDEDNIKEFLDMENYHQLSWIVTNYQSDKNLIKKVIEILLNKQKFRFIEYILQHHNQFISNEIIKQLSTIDIILLLMNIKKDQIIDNIIVELSKNKEKIFDVISKINYSSNVNKSRTLFKKLNEQALL